MTTAGKQGIEPAPAPHLFLEEQSVMGRQEKNPKVCVMEETAVLEVNMKKVFYLGLYHISYRLYLCWLF